MFESLPSEESVKSSMEYCIIILYAVCCWSYCLLQMQRFRTVAFSTQKCLMFLKDYFSQLKGQLASNEDWLTPWAVDSEPAECWLVDLSCRQGCNVRIEKKPILSSKSASTSIRNIVTNSVDVRRSSFTDGVLRSMWNYVASVEWNVLEVCERGSKLILKAHIPHTRGVRNKRVL